jgi:hypothetical protein
VLSLRCSHLSISAICIHDVRILSRYVHTFSIAVALKIKFMLSYISCLQIYSSKSRFAAKVPFYLVPLFELPFLLDLDDSSLCVFFFEELVLVEDGSVVSLFCLEELVLEEDCSVDSLFFFEELIPE